MFVRTSSRRNKDGTVVSYLQLVHNDWDPAAKSAKMRVLYNFGRTDQVDRVAIERLIDSLTRVVNPDSGTGAGTDAGLSFTSSRPLGGAWVLDHLWSTLGIEKTLTRLVGGTRRDAATERVVFALVANRALAPSSKLAAATWVGADVHIPGLPEVSDDACYRAMDWLLAVEPELGRAVYDQVADLLNLEVDLLFFDTTSTYFETESADAPVWRESTGQRVDTDAQTLAEDDSPPGAVGRAGFRTWGKSKDHRDDLPQIVVGMAVTREGIPVRVWSWPGNTADSALIRQVKADLREWNLGRVIWVTDRGFTSLENRRALTRGGGGYIMGEKLRSGSPEVAAVLARPGRYHHVKENLQVKEVHLGDGDRFVIAYNPEAATRDAAVRADLVARLEEQIADSDGWTADRRAQLRGVISTKPGLNRYLRTTPTGLLRLDAGAITAEAKLDGKYLLRTNDPTLSAEDVALGYKQLAEVERGWRDMKQVLDLRPVYHRLEDRIRAHVILCWLALLLIRVIETTTDQTWPTIRAELQRLHVGVFTGNAGTYQQTTDLTPAQRGILTQLKVPTPPRILTLNPAG